MRLRAYCSGVVIWGGMCAIACREGVESHRMPAQSYRNRLAENSANFAAVSRVVSARRRVCIELTS